MNYNFSQFELKLKEIKEWLQKELKTVRTGRATPSVLDAIRAENYGALMPLNQMANVTIEDAKTLRINPFDPGSIKEIERAITEANLGLSIVVDDSELRVIFPELTGERRQELVKMAKDKLEEARISVRGARDEVWSDIQTKEKTGEMTEDEKYNAKEKMEELSKSANEELEKLFVQKEKEILEE
jgi:ribosome recycling factor